MANQKKNIETLSNFPIDLDKFFTITIRDDGQIELMAFLKKEIREECEKAGFKFELTNNQWILGKKDKIEIYLTF